MKDGDANKTMGREFARVEPYDTGDEKGSPYFKLVAANMMLSEGFDGEELQEMADGLNRAVESAVAKAVEEERRKALEEAAKVISGYGDPGYFKGGYVKRVYADEMADAVRALAPKGEM